MDKASGPIYDSDLASLTKLELENKRIRDLHGIQYCTSLVALNLWNNDIDDITPLKALRNLAWLSLGRNARLSDISPISSLTGISYLHLGWTDVSDISVLARLSRLRNLILWYCHIEDISALSYLQGLVELNLYANEVRDVAPLACHWPG